MEVGSGGAVGGNATTVVMEEIIVNYITIGGKVLDGIHSAPLGLDPMQLAAVRVMSTPVLGSAERNSGDREAW